MNRPPTDKLMEDPDTFSRLHEGVRQVLAYRLGWDELRQVQEEAYAAVVAGNDILVIAPTAGGKTEAALIPVIDGILKGSTYGVAAIYLAPLKALINDQEERFRAFCLPNGLDILKWHGDVPKGDRSWGDEDPPHILMITPESLEVLLMEQDLARDLLNLRYVIIDELHAFIESDRGVQMRVLLDRLDRVAGKKLQRIGLSATLGNPQEILRWLSGKRHGEVLVQVPAPPRPKHFSFVIEEDEQRRADALARIVRGKKALVFVNSRSDAEGVNTALAGQVDEVLVHHSSLSPQMRSTTEQAFSQAGSACIICTSTLELGIDIGDLDVVVQFGPPHSVSSFLQRMGRSGRRGKPPYVACMLKDARELLCMAAVIELASRKEVEPLTPQRKPYNVLVQQVLLELVRKRRTSMAHILRFIHGLSPFRSIRTPQIDLLIRHLVESGILIRDGDMLMPGPEAELTYGRSNWKDLFSVIHGSGEFRAVTPEGEMVGTLDARFVAGGSGRNFTLGGKSWKFLKSDDSHELVVVVPGEGGKSEVFWTGGRAGFSELVCQGVGEIIRAGGSSLPLLDGERGTLEGLIQEFPPLDPGSLTICERPGKKGPEVLVHTFRGQRWNSILAALLKAGAGRRLVVGYDDFSLQVRNAGKEHAGRYVRDILQEIKKRKPAAVAGDLALPGRETWKFSGAIPAQLLWEMAREDYYRFPEFFSALVATDLVLDDRF